MRVVGEVNSYVTEQAPCKLKDDAERDRLATILHVLAQAVSDCNIAAVAVPALQRQRRRCRPRRRRRVAPMPRIVEVDDLDGGAGYPVITGDYSQPTRWERRPVTPGTPVGKPSPVFTKLDPSVVDEELARLGLDGDA